MMRGDINTILVPVDFSKSTELAISKALEFCPQGNAKVTIHLYHVERILRGLSCIFSRLVTGIPYRNAGIELRDSIKQLEMLKLEIENKRENVIVFYWVSFGDSVQGGIVKKAKLLSPDLIIIGKQSQRSHFLFLNTVISSEIAFITGIPVLTAKPGSLHQEIKTVVVPVYQIFPQNKLKMLAVLRNKSRPRIRLVIFEGNDMEWIVSKQLLLDTFRVIKSQFINLVDYEVLKGGNKARALLKYCNKIDADVLIVSPETETRISKWANSHISDLVPSESKTQILAVMPG